MSNELMKLGPLVGFLLTVGYCVWPHVAPPPYRPEPAAQLPKIDPDQLHPQFPPHPARDPFQNTFNRIEPPSVAEAPAEAPAEPNRPGASTPPKPREPDRPPPFALGATLVSGDRRAAIIDGRVYRQGETLEPPPGSSRHLWTVSRIEPGRVVLGQANRREPVVLELPDRLAALLAESSESAPTAAASPARGTGWELLAEGRTALAAAGVHLPVPDLMEQIAMQSGGSVREVSRSLLKLLLDPPRPPGNGSGTTAMAASVEGPR